MEAIIAALDEQQIELDGLLVTLDDVGWAKPSRCPGWSVAGVVLHLAQTSELAAAVGDASFLERAVIAERGAPAAQLFQRWQIAAAAAHAPHRVRPDSTPAVGELSARTLATTRLSTPASARIR